MNKLIQQIFRFAIVGGSAFIIDYFGMILLTEIVGLHYLMSSIISFTLSVIYNYVLSVVWVFKVNQKMSVQKQFLIFVLLSIVGLGLNTIFMWLTTDCIHLDYRLSKVIATALVMIYNFISRKLFLESKEETNG